MSSSRYRIHQITSPRFAMLGWLSLWMIVIPFMHIHAEVDHDHGQQAHVHKAVAHSIFSDLPGEFEEPAHPADSLDLNEVSTVPSEHLEIVFTSLFSSADSSSVKFAALVCVLSHNDPKQLLRTFQQSVFSAHGPPSFLLLVDLSPRAPPVVSI
jgi:hypothetical protein